MKNRLSAILATAMILSAVTAFAAVREGDFSISPVIGGYTYDGREHLKSTPVYGLRAGYNFTKELGVEGLFDYASTDAKDGSKKDVSMYRFGGELLYHLWPDNDLVPYVAAGYAGKHLYENSSNYNTVGAFDYGLGAKYFLNDRFALRADVRHIIFGYDNKTYNNAEYTLGAYIPFGGVKPAAKAIAEPLPQESSQPKAAPVEVKIVAEQPSSTLSAMPSAIISGQTSRLNWTSQNAKNCEIQPGIGSVPLQGSKDITPSSDTSYTLTCSGDGGKTASVSTVAVTAPAVAQPPAMSAQKAAAAQRFCDKPAVLEVQFDTNKSDITPKYRADLEKLAEFLKEFPNAKGVISGHTDSVGGKALNMKLSQRRAESVEQYMKKNFGIDPDRLTAKGFGFSKPVASNKTKKGRAQNRRIEANLSCK